MNADAEALFDEGNRCLAAGDYAGAERCFGLTALLLPDSAAAHANLAFAFEGRGALAEAEAAYRRALALAPGIVRIHLNFGALLAAQKRFADAEVVYRQALALDERSPAAWSNLGALYASVGREDEAEHCHRTALALDPDYRKAAFNLSYLLLRQGRFAEGWRRIEARDWYAGLAARLQLPRWQGEDVAGRAVLIGCEAGHGDMIQFCRYAAELKALGAARVGLICHPALKTLFASLEAVDRLYALDEALDGEGWDCWTPPLSIPCHLGTTLDTIPARLPYLHAMPERIAHWAARLPDDGLRVGLVWRGNPRFENDADRSLPALAVLAPLFDVPGIRFVSLQKGAGETEAEAVGGPLLPLGPALQDFADTAAVVSQLDLVIAVDTAVAHLAGALGRPVWVLLPAYQTDWRWLENRADSPWYPGVMHLFRQPAMGEWAPVVATLHAALAAWRGAENRGFSGDRRGRDGAMVGGRE